MNAVSSSLCKFPWPCATPFQAKYYCYHYKPNLRHWNVALDSFGKEHRIMKRETTVKTYSSRVEMAVNEGKDKFEQVEKQIRSDLSVVVLDIEGTTTPIAFVTESLYPYARNNVRSYLLSTFESEETQADINLLRKQAEEDFKAGTYGAKLVPPSDSNKEDIVEAVAANVFAMIQADRKVTALKELQGHIWRYGFGKGELQGDVFEDVPRAFSQWHADGAKVYIYSSGSREAQRLIFGNTQYGDLRRFLSGYFDTVTAGNKREPRSYKEICLSVGVDEPSQVVFATDVIQEAIAAKEAGLRAVIVIRPGNAPLPLQHDFTTITTLLEL